MEDLKQPLPPDAATAAAARHASPRPAPRAALPEADEPAEAQEASPPCVTVPGVGAGVKEGVQGWRGC